MIPYHPLPWPTRTPLRKHPWETTITRNGFVSFSFKMSSYSYQRVPHPNPHTANPNQSPPLYAPRPHRWQASTLPPPPKMDKNLFDRCGNCTRAFGFLSRKVQITSKREEIDCNLETLRQLRVCVLFWLLWGEIQIIQVSWIRCSRFQSLWLL